MWLGDVPSTELGATLETLLWLLWVLETPWVPPLSPAVAAQQCPNTLTDPHGRSS